VRATGTPRFSPPPPAAGRPPDVLCERGIEDRSLCFEVELPETLVRRETVSRLRLLALNPTLEPRLVLVGASDAHARQIAEARRMLRRAGLPLAVAAIAPDEETITGADW
jgi:hypothetical protein